MQVAGEVPEGIAEILKGAWHDLPRGVLEAVAVERYRGGALSRGEVGRLLGLSFWKTEAFLAERRAYLPYREEDLRQDRADVDRGRRP
jgi:predicted HTH domain antitoxin